MKNLFFLLVAFLLFNSSVNSQWQQQVTNLPSQHYINWIDAVNENICWVTAYKYPGTSPWLGFSRSTDGGSIWICDTLQSVSGIFKCIHALNANTAYVSIKNQGEAGRIFKTTDGGNSWLQQTIAFTLLNDAAKYIHFFDELNGIAIGERQGNYFEIFTTTNGGTNWSRVADANMPSLLSNEFLFGDDYTASGNSIWFLTSESRIFRSTNKGLNWDYINSPESFSGGDPNIEFSDEVNGILITNSNSLWKTTNSGNNWSSMFYSGNFSPRLISFVSGTWGTYVLAAQGGSNYTPDNGNSYIPIDSDAHYHIDFASALAGWTDGSTAGYIYKWVGTFVSVEDDNYAVSEYKLDQNYPNPFNPSTVISYQLPVSSDVTLKVYDILGNEIETLVNEEQSAGVYEIEFDASKLSSGIYFYQLKAGNYINTKKMILIK
jgi:photosystem II stability/assembly factor-like uncharacterized protein